MLGPQRGFMMITATAALAIASTGCASTAPIAQTHVAEAAVARAASVGAEDLAPARLRQAREKLELSRKLGAGNANTPALWLAEQAEADADVTLAVVLFRRACELAQELVERLFDGGRK